MPRRHRHRKGATLTEIAFACGFSSSSDSSTTFDATLMAEVEIKGAVDVELRALEWLFLEWLPTTRPE